MDNSKKKKPKKGTSAYYCELEESPSPSSSSSSQYYSQQDQKVYFTQIPKPPGFEKYNFDDYNYYGPIQNLNSFKQELNYYSPKPPGFEKYNFGPTENLTSFKQESNYDSVQMIFNKSTVGGIVDVNYAYNNPYNTEEHNKILQTLNSNVNNTTWTCRECLYASNALHINICQRCQRLRSGLGLQNSISGKLNQDIIKGNDILLQNQNWICGRCTLSNNNNSLTCEACYASRMDVNYAYNNGYNAEEHKKILQMLNTNVNNTTWTCRECLYTSNALHINICQRCQRLRSGLGLQNSISGKLNQDIIKVENQNWICGRCTLSNNNNSLTCEACYASRMESLSISDQYLSSNSKNKKFTKRKKLQKRSETKETSKSVSCNNLRERRCITCTFKNLSSEYCDMCENMRKYYDEPEQLNQNEITELQNCEFKKKMYVDETFPTTINSLYYTHPEKCEIIKWRRLRNITLNDTDKSFVWDIFRCPLEPTDVRQGVLGNCWFMSALSVLVENENLVRNIVLTKYLSPEGMYQIRLCKDGEWVIVSVDDIFSCDKNGKLLYGQAVRKQLWVPLIEKACAKMYGCYEALANGCVSEGFVALTGAPCESILFGSSDKIDTDFIWAQLLAAREAFFLMGATCGGGKVEVSKEDMRKKGLHKNHMYSILEVFNMGKYRILKLRDPHGEFDDSYNDDWHLLLVTKFPGWEAKKGIFWIEFKDLLKYFSSVGICKIRSGWYETRLSGNLSLIPPSQQELLSCISLIINEPTEIDLMLHQNSQREIERSKRNLSDICVAVLKINRNSSNIVTNSRRLFHSFVDCYKILEPGEYIIIPFTFHQWHLKLETETNLKYVLAIHSSRKISVEPVTTSPEALGETILSLALVNGECQKLMKHFNVYYLTKDFAGAAIVAENKYKNKWIQLNCEPSKEFVNFVSTRGSKNTVDFIPPKHRQVIAVCTFLHGVTATVVEHYLDYSISMESNVNELHIPEIDQADGLHLPRLIL